MITGLVTTSALIAILGIIKLTRGFMDDFPIHHSFDELWFEN